MNAERMQKMFASGDSNQIRKASAELMDGLVKLERDVTALEAQPLHVPHNGYHVVEKGSDDGMASCDRHFGTLNGSLVDLDALARGVQKFSAG